MWRKIIGFAIALFVWGLVATILDRMMRAGLPGYAAAEPAMTFTLSMQWFRLALGALASLSAGFTLSRVAPNGRWLPLIFGALLLAMFLPTHYTLWAKFPIWYHLLFLLTIIPWVIAGAKIGTRTTNAADSRFAQAA